MCEGYANCDEYNHDEMRPKEPFPRKAPISKPFFCNSVRCPTENRVSVTPLRKFINMLWVDVVIRSCVYIHVTIHTQFVYP